MNPKFMSLRSLAGTGVACLVFSSIGSAEGRRISRSSQGGDNHDEVKENDNLESTVRHPLIPGTRPLIPVTYQRAEVNALNDVHKSSTLNNENKLKRASGAFQECIELPPNAVESPPPKGTRTSCMQGQTPQFHRGTKSSPPIGSSGKKLSSPSKSEHVLTPRAQYTLLTNDDNRHFETKDFVRNDNHNLTPRKIMRIRRDDEKLMTGGKKSHSQKGCSQRGRRMSISEFGVQAEECTKEKIIAENPTLSLPVQESDAKDEANDDNDNANLDAQNDAQQVSTRTDENLRIETRDMWKFDLLADRKEAQRIQDKKLAEQAEALANTVNANMERLGDAERRADNQSKPAIVTQKTTPLKTRTRPVRVKSPRDDDPQAIANKTPDQAEQKSGSEGTPAEQVQPEQPKLEQPQQPKHSLQTPRQLHLYKQVRTDANYRFGPRTQGVNVADLAATSADQLLESFDVAPKSQSFLERVAAKPRRAGARPAPAEHRDGAEENRSQQAGSDLSEQAGSVERDVGVEPVGVETVEKMGETRVSMTTGVGRSVGRSRSSVRKADGSQGSGEHENVDIVDPNIVRFVPRNTQNTTQRQAPIPGFRAPIQGQGEPPTPTTPPKQGQGATQDVQKIEQSEAAPRLRVGGFAPGNGVSGREVEHVTEHTVAHQEQQTKQSQQTVAKQKHQITSKEEQEGPLHYMLPCDFRNFNFQGCQMISGRELKYGLTSLEGKETDDTFWEAKAALKRATTAELVDGLLEGCDNHNETSNRDRKPSDIQLQNLPEFDFGPFQEKEMLKIRKANTLTSQELKIKTQRSVKDQSATALQNNNITQVKKRGTAPSPSWNQAIAQDNMNRRSSSCSEVEGVADNMNYGEGSFDSEKHLHDISPGKFSSNTFGVPPTLKPNTQNMFGGPKGSILRRTNFESYEPRGNNCIDPKKCNNPHACNNPIGNNDCEFVGDLFGSGVPGRKSKLSLLGEGDVGRTMKTVVNEKGKNELTVKEEVKEEVKNEEKLERNENQNESSDEETHREEAGVDVVDITDVVNLRGSTGVSLGPKAGGTATTNHAGILRLPPKWVPKIPQRLPIQISHQVPQIPQTQISQAQQTQQRQISQIPQISPRQMQNQIYEAPQISANQIHQVQQRPQMQNPIQQLQQSSQLQQNQIYPLQQDIPVHQASAGSAAKEAQGSQMIIPDETHAVLVSEMLQLQAAGRRDQAQRKLQEWRERQESLGRSAGLKDLLSGIPHEFCTENDENGRENGQMRPNRKFLNLCLSLGPIETGRVYNLCHSMGRQKMEELDDQIWKWEEEQIRLGLSTCMAENKTLEGLIMEKKEGSEIKGKPIYGSGTQNKSNPQKGNAQKANGKNFLKGDPDRPKGAYTKKKGVENDINKRKLATDVNLDVYVDGIDVDALEMPLNLNAPLPPVPAFSEAAVVVNPSGNPFPVEMANGGEAHTDVAHELENEDAYEQRVGREESGHRVVMRITDENIVSDDNGSDDDLGCGEEVINKENVNEADDDLACNGEKIRIDLGDVGKN